MILLEHYPQNGGVLLLKGDVEVVRVYFFRSPLGVKCLLIGGF